MRIRKRNRILRRVVLGFAVLALVVPSAALAVPDAGRSYQPTQDEGSVQLADPKFGQESGVSVVLADPKFGQETGVSVVLADPKFGQETREGVQLADPKFGQPDGAVYIPFGDYPKPVEVGTYGLPHAGLNDYIRTHNGKALVTEQENVSTPQVIVSSGFDWSDAGIGAGILAGLLIVIGGAVLAARELGRPQTA
jgi:hypothetical protein